LNLSKPYILGQSLELSKQIVNGKVLMIKINISTHKYYFFTKMFPEINKEISITINEWRIAACGCCRFWLITQIEAGVKSLERYFREECT
jgi:hypothetical protein